MTMDTARQETLSKVPQVTLLFWILKVLATTLGETGGDALSMGKSGGADASEGTGYLMGTGIFAAVFAMAVLVQIMANKFHPVIYWTTIAATTTVGTTLADFADRSLGIGYPGGTAILLTLLVCSLAAWRYTLGTISVESVRAPKAEIFYWVTIMFSQTLGTALGDWTADSVGFGYGGSALIFGGFLAVVAAAYYWTHVSHTLLFWAAFVLTRPLGAVVGDLLDKPHESGGLALSRYTASGVLVALIALGIVVFPQKPAGAAH